MAGDKLPAKLPEYAVALEVSASRIGDSSWLPEASALISAPSTSRPWSSSTEEAGCEDLEAVTRNDGDEDPLSERSASSWSSAEIFETCGEEAERREAEAEIVHGKCFSYHRFPEIFDHTPSELVEAVCDDVEQPIVSNPCAVAGGEEEPTLDGLYLDPWTSEEIVVEPHHEEGATGCADGASKAIDLVSETEDIDIDDIVRLAATKFAVFNDQEGEMVADPRTNYGSVAEGNRSFFESPDEDVLNEQDVERARFAATESTTETASHEDEGSSLERDLKPRRKVHQQILRGDLQENEEWAPDWDHRALELKSRAELGLPNLYIEASEEVDGTGPEKCEPGVESEAEQRSRFVSVF